MKKLVFLSLFILIFSGCKSQPPPEAALNTPPSLTSSATSLTSNSTDSPVDETPYAGIFIDQQFPFTEHGFAQEQSDGENVSIKVGDYDINFKGSTPQTIERKGKTVFRFKTLYPEDYHASFIGTSNLLGKDSKELYVVAAGPGAVCCSNYWIVDISGDQPRQIFRSEDFGGFRDAMEIFDADGDGTYELMQWDSAFRYMLDDCGACSPEPRAVFKYDAKSGAYRPAKGLRQEFLMSFDDREKELEVESEEMIVLTDGSSVNDPKFYRNLNAYVVDLIYYGDEKRAWRIFDKYYGKDEKETRAEIKHRLANSKFYQAIKKQK